MKINTIRIKNFRLFTDQTINIDDYATFIGANGSGKSTILAALNIFFRQNESSTTDVINLEAEDFHKKNTKEPIEVSVTFSDLNAEAMDDFKHYVRHDLLTITASAEFDEDSQRAIVKQYGERKIFPDFRPYFKKLKEKANKVAELKQIYATLCDGFADLPTTAKTKDAMTDALRAYEEARPDECELERSEEQFYGLSKGVDRLRKYVNWVYVPAVKDASDENSETRNSVFSTLLSLAVRSKVNFDDELTAIKDKARKDYQKLLDGQQSALEGISEALTKRVAALTHDSAVAEIKWTEDESKSVSIMPPSAKLFAGDGNFLGNITRFGHGFQRCYLLALLQELAAVNLEHSPTLILGIEEPELYQHPPQARHLADVLKRLSEANSQILVTSHSPYFISGENFERVHIVRRQEKDGASLVMNLNTQEFSDRWTQSTGKKLLPIAAHNARLHQALNPHINEMFFCSAVVLVEGIEDVAYITSWMSLTERWQTFRSLGAHIVPVAGKSNIIRPAIIASLLKIPHICIFDSDGSATTPKERSEHSNDNIAIQKALGFKSPVDFPSEHVFQMHHIQWIDEIGEHVRDSVGKESWDKAFGAARKTLGNPPGDFKKNPIFIAELLHELRSKDIKISILDDLCDSLIKSIQTQTGSA